MTVRDISVRLYELDYPKTDVLQPDVQEPVYTTQQPAAPNAWYRYVVSGEGTIDGVALSPGLYVQQPGPSRTVQYTVTNGPLKLFDIIPDLYTDVASAEYITQSLSDTDAANDTMVVYEVAAIKLDDVVVEVNPAAIAQAGSKLEVDLVQPNTAVVLKVAVPVEVQNVE